MVHRLLFLFLDLDLPSRQLECLYNVGEEVFQMYVQILLSKGEIHIFTEPAQPVEDSQAGPAIECGMLEETAPL